MARETSSRDPSGRPAAARDRSTGASRQHERLNSGHGGNEKSEWPDDQLTLLKALRFDGYKNHEIADIMGVAESDVFIQISRLNPDTIEVAGARHGDAQETTRERGRDDLKRKPIENFTSLLGRVISAASIEKPEYLAALKAIKAGKRVVVEAGPQDPAMQSGADSLDRAVHPGALLAQRLGEGASVAELAHQMGVTRQALYALLNEQVRLSAAMAQKLEDHQLIDSAEAWLGMQAAYDLAELRVKSPPRPRRQRRPMPT